MLTYLSTLDYDDREQTASVAPCMVRERETGIREATSTETSSLSKKQQSRYSRMINNVAVYAIAQKYGVPQLKALTMVKFHQLLQHLPDNPTILSVVNEVFGTSSSQSSGLREFVIDYCTHFAGEYIHDEKINGMIKDHGDLGLGMLQRMHTRHLQEKKELSRQIKQLQGCEKVFFSRVQGMKARLLDIMSMADSMNMPDKSGNASSHLQAQKSLKNLRGRIRQLHNLARVEDWGDTGLETRSPA